MSQSVLPYSTIEVTKSLEDVIPETDTVHPSNINKAAEMHEGKSVERQPLLLLKLFYCLACLFQSAEATILFLIAHLKKLSCPIVVSR